MMYDFFKSLLCGITGIILAGGLWACASANTGTGHDVQSSAEQLGELREQNRQLTERLNREQELYIELRDAIGRAEIYASTAIDYGTRAIQLFIAYKRGIDDYFAGIERIKRETVSSP